jgi:CheY-like chemotaxis protein
MEIQERREARPVSQEHLQVLIVEDDPESREYMGALLDLWGYRPRLAAEGRTALSLAQEAMPDVVLLDLGLPGLDGFEVAQELRRLPGGGAALIVAVTAFRGEEHRLRAEEAGFDKYLMKPVDIETLRLVLAGAARRDPPPAEAS